MNFVIRRDEWLRGEGFNQSSLLRTRDGKRCCIGIYGRALGIPDEDMRDVPAAPVNDPRWPQWIGDGIYEANDQIGLDEERREARITKIFGKHGDSVVFE